MKEIFYLENLYFDHFATKCGWKGTLVYLALCRLSNQEGISFPSVEYLARKLNVSKDTVSRGIHSLLQQNIVSRKLTKQRRAYGNYIYQINDKTVWGKFLPPVDK